MSCCCFGGGGPSEGQRELINKFIKIARDDISNDWIDHSRESDGPRGTKIESRKVNEYTYWRGIAEFPVSCDLVAWFLGNQSEFNSLSDTIDPLVLGEKINVYFRRNATEVLKMKRKGPIDQSTQKWTVQMPVPIAPREFLIKERQVTIRDGSRVMVAQSVRSRKDGQNIPGASDYSDYDESGLVSTYGESVVSTGGFGGSVGLRKSGRPKSAKSLGPGGPGKNRTSVGELSMTPMNPESPTNSSSSGSIVSGKDRKSRSAAGSGSILTRKEAKGRRGNVLVSGYLITSTRGGRACEVVFVSCIDPMLTDEDYEAMAVLAGDGDEADGSSLVEQRALIDDLLGMSRVLQGLESPRRYWEDPKAYWAQQLFRLATSGLGEMGWEKLETKRYGEEKMQTGTHVTHKVFGHGVIKQFDLRGEARVVFDSGKEKNFNPNQLEKYLSAAIELGTRVLHPSRGFGTVKHFDAERIHVKFDNGEYHRYTATSWQKKMHLTGQTAMSGHVEMSKCRQVDLQGITDRNAPMTAGVSAVSKPPKRRTLSLVKLEKKKKEPKSIKAEVLRVSFTISQPTEVVFEQLKQRHEEEKSGLIVEDKVLKEHSPNHITSYQRYKYPQGLNDRDFVFDTTWSEVDTRTYLLVSKSTQIAECPPIPGVVRADLVIRGYLVEPLYEKTNLAAGQQLYSRVTYITCMEPRGFVPPKVVEAMNRTELIGVVTDTRAHFYKEGLGGSKNAAIAAPPKRISTSAKSKMQRRSIRRASTLDLSEQNETKK